MCWSGGFVTAYRIVFGLALRPVPERRVKTRLTCVPGSIREAVSLMALRLVGCTIGVGSFVPSGSHPPTSARAPAQHAPRSCPPKEECRSLSGAWRAGRRWTGVPRPGAEDRLVPPRRAPAGRHIDRLAHQGPVPRVVAPVAYPTAFWVQQPGDGRQTDRVPPRVLIQVDAAHPPHSRACWRREPRLTT